MAPDAGASNVAIVRITKKKSKKRDEDVLPPEARNHL